jgi:fructokinase
MDTSFFTGLSSDMFGDILREALTASGVDHSYCATLDLHTTLAFVRLVDGQASYAFFDENTAGRMITEAHLPDFGDNRRGPALRRHQPDIRTLRLHLRKPDAARAWIAGDLARSQHPARLHHRCGKAPGPHRPDDRHERYPEDVGRGSRMVWSARHGDRGRFWLDQGPSLVVFTRGAKGAIGFSRDHTVEVDGVAVTVADTVGAGDTFNAGILASLKRDGVLTKQAIKTLSAEAIGNALRLGAKAAAVTVSRPGANPPWASEIGF